MKNNKVLSIQDISCYGQCSLTVALPILSRFGFETVIMPSAILSTHTSGFKNFTCLDLTEEMPKILAHWIKTGVKVNSIYTGYIGDKRQFDTILECKEKVLEKKGLFFVDPAMADDGELYGPLNQEIVEGMKKITAVADYVIPNITEACFLTNTPYQNKQDDDFIQTLISKLLEMGAKNVILTGVTNGEDQIGVISANKDRRVEVYKEKLVPSYHGTGDVFSSVCISYILRGLSIEEVLDKTTDFVCKCIIETRKDKEHVYGVKFEKILSEDLYEKESNS